MPLGGGPIDERRHTLHNYGTGMKRRQKRDELLAGVLPAEDCITTFILTMYMEAMLPKVNSNQRNFLHDDLRR
jgi:hypothetical protein